MYIYIIYIYISYIYNNPNNRLRIWNLCIAKNDFENGNFGDIFWVWPPPSNSAKWRCIGIPYWKWNNPCGDCYWEGAASKIYWYRICLLILLHKYIYNYIYTYTCTYIICNYTSFMYSTMKKKMASFFCGFWQLSKPQISFQRVRWPVATICVGMKCMESSLSYHRDRLLGCTKRFFLVFCVQKIPLPKY